MRDERSFSRGFSLLELLIVLVVISVLTVVAIDRLLRLRFEAERVMVESMVSGLKSALYIEFAAAAARGKSEAMVAARGSNPMTRLAERPDTYAGEFSGADPASVAPGTWYFDTRDRTLVYVVRFPEQFVTTLAGPARARFSVEPDYDDANGNGRLDPGSESMRGLRLVPVEPFSWREAT